MDRRVAVALVALIVATVPIGASPSPPADRGPADGTVARLGISEDQLDRTGEVRVGPDVGVALSAGTDGLHVRFGVLLVRERYHTADSRLARQRLLARELDAVAARVARLQDLEREAIRRYAIGEISGRALLHAVAGIDSEVARLQDAVETVRVLAAGLPSESLVARAEDVEARLVPLRGPVRDRVAAAIAGAEPPTRVHVEASETGLVLGVLENQTFVREATRLDHRDDASSDPPVTVATASQRAIDRYPRAFNSSRSSNIDVLGRDVFQVVVDHDRGSVTGYVDASTGRVFREYQRLHVPAMPTRRIATIGSPDVRLALERTYPGGPLRVTLANESRTTRIEPLGTPEPPGHRNVPAGTALDGAVVIVGDEVVGHTGPEGTLWLVEPRGPYTLAAIHGSTMVNVSIDPTLASTRPDRAEP